MADEAQAEVKPKKGMKLIILVLVVFLVMGLSAGAFLFLSSKKAEEEKPAKKAKKTKEVVMVDMDPIIVNLFDPTGRRYLQVRLTFEVEDKKAEAELKKYDAKLKDSVISILSGKTVEDVIVPEAKEKIKREILAKCDEIFGKDVVTNVYLTQFLVE